MSRVVILCVALLASTFVTASADAAGRFFNFRSSGNCPNGQCGTTVSACANGKCPAPAAAAAEEAKESVAEQKPVEEAKEAAEPTVVAQATSSARRTRLFSGLGRRFR